MLAATAGPRQAQATGTRALQQTIAGVSPLDKSVVATTNWSLVNTSFGGGGPAEGGSAVQLIQANLATVTSQLRRDFSGGPLTLDPQSADWAALTSEPYSLGRFPVLKNERDPREAGGGLPLPAGRPPAAGGRHHADRLVPRSAGRQAIQVVITQAMASTFGLEPGSSVSIGVPSDVNPGGSTRSTST